MKSSAFGLLPTGELVESFILENANGVSVGVITYGATITSVRVPGREGRFADVVLGFNELSSYLAPHPYIGAMVGRVAGRLGGGRFELDGRAYELAVNDPPNHLHGGVVGFNRKMWSASPESELSLRLTNLSPDGEEGYPGNVRTEVIYTLTADNTLVAETRAETDKSTPFSLTQHSYFNLAGEGSGSIRGHQLQINATEFAPTDEHFTLLGRRESVLRKANDLTSSRIIGEVIPRLHKGHGDLYFFPPKSTTVPYLAARLHDPVSGRTLTLSTTEDCIQLYTGIGLDGTLLGKSGQAYGPCAGIALECEGYPDGPNSPTLGDIILRSDQSYRQTTIYAFSTE